VKQDIKKLLMVQLSENSQKILARRYLHRDLKGGIIETPEQLFHRVAAAVAKAELCWGKKEDVHFWEEKFYRTLSNLHFLPNSPTLMNAGASSQQLSACFVLPVEDSMDSIFSTLKNAALIQQSGGGTGFNFSQLRPKDDMVSVSGGTASGPVSFMKIFDAATEYVKQGGKRRGANMGILNISHPDIETFISAKKEKGVLRNFNISAGITDAFMQALTDNAMWNLIHPNHKGVVKKIHARKLWQDIVASAWQTGDPGLVFLDTINFRNPTPELGQIESTNPCGEVPLLPYESCNLGSINLTKMVREKSGQAEIDWEKLEETITIATRFLDNVIEVNHYIIGEIKTMTMGNRKIGLGVMGWAELLILLEIPYDTEEAVDLAEKIMSFIREKSIDASVSLARSRGVFPNWAKSIYYPDSPIRNATRTSIAPTGTISIIADTSSSIEPLFALAFQRQHVLNDETLFSLNSSFIRYLKIHGLYDEKILEQVKENGTTENMQQLPARVKNIFKTSLEISPAWHLRHQLAFQKFTDNAVSKTINMPEKATQEDVGEIYESAWRGKAKGITIFRYHSTDKQVLHQGIGSASDACRVCKS
jgi:ribonucleoside-diphosphate reductase alpha chain